MPSPLREHQHEILDLDEGTGYVFGTDDTGWLTTTYPTISQGDMRLGDTEPAQEDGVGFGRDYRGAKTYGFEMTAITDSVNGLGGNDVHRAVLDRLDALEAVWTDEKWRNNPQAYAILRSYAGGVVSRCYGRPRRWDEATGDMTMQGITPVVADFQLKDNRWYADAESSASVGLPATADPLVSGSGLVAPLVAPLTTVLPVTSAAPSGQTGAKMTVTGSVSTWIVTEFHGPMTDPVLTIGGTLVIGLKGSIGSGQVVTVDPRPWARTVTRNSDGAGLGGWLSGDTPLMRDMRLKPGTYTMQIKGSGSSGGSYAVARWRAARNRP